MGFCDRVMLGFPADSGCSENGYLWKYFCVTHLPYSSLYDERFLLGLRADNPEGLNRFEIHSIVMKQFLMPIFSEAMQ